jgi:hypothetical protein
MTGYTSHHGSYLAHRLTLEGRDDDAFAKSLSTARVETKPHQALEHAQAMAAHESPRTTQLYDRTTERLTQDEIERIVM